jgi:AraC family transcriptional regulator, regulatory protein of adaptative response / DNA-3-methyladenine glycosylase II
MGTSAVVQRALRLIQDGALDQGSAGDFANRLGIGSRHLSRLFVKHIGATPAVVAQTRRVHFAKRLLDDTRLSITDIALASGFGSIRRFNDAFRATYQRSPRQLRKRHSVGRDTTEGGELTLRLAYRPPYDWAQVRAFLAKRAIPGLEVVTADGYARVVRTHGGHAVLQIQPVAQMNALLLRIQGAMPAELPPLLSSVRRMFDLTADPIRIATVLASEKQLRPLFRRRPGLRIPGSWDPFECGVRTIIEQHIDGAAATTLLGLLVEQFGEPIESRLTHMTHLFPTPAVLADANLDNLGLPNSIRHAVRVLARGVDDNTIRFDASGVEVRRMLCALPGVGRWMAEYVMLRGLGEPDAFPFGDLLLRRRMSKVKKALSPRELESRAELWRPFRGYAFLHLWTEEHYA